PISQVPRASIKVDLPTPGTPETPTRTAPPAWGVNSPNRSRARLRWSGRLDSTRVMARASADRLPATTCAANSSGSGAIRACALRGALPGPVPEVRAELCEQREGTVGDDRAGQEDLGGTHLPQRGHVVGRDDSAD